MRTPAGAAGHEKVKEPVVRSALMAVSATLNTGAGGTSTTAEITCDADAVPRAFDAVSVTGKLPGPVYV
jgi:hypothetical protein